MSVNYGALNFTDPSLNSGQTSEATYAWINNTGSFAEDWQVQIDLNLNLTPMTGQVSVWELIVGNTTTPADNFTVAMQRTYMQVITSQPPLIQAYTEIGGTMIAPGTVSANNVDLSTTTARISYQAATTTLTAAYDGNGATGGYTFTNLHSVDISDTASNWNMVTGDTFSLELVASNFTSSGSTMPTVEGAFFADNFFASSTAVPEPATIALLAGLSVLGFCFWRRRA